MLKKPLKKKLDDYLGLNLNWNINIKEKNFYQKS